MIELFEPRIAPASFIVDSLADAGAGSLRDAIAEANNHPGADLVIFAKGLSGTIAITSGQIEITDALTIKGPGATKLALDANLQSRFFFVSDGDKDKNSPLNVSGLSLFRGKQPTTAGAGESGGAIESLESLKVKGCAFVRNEADGGGGAVRLAQLANGAPISIDIRDSSFVSNSNDRFSGGAVEAFVGGAVTVKNSVFQDNSSGHDGGAVSLGAGKGETLLVQNSQFFGNHAVGGAGGAELLSEGGSSVIVRNGLFANNTTLESGGGGAEIFGGKVVIEKTAFVQNIAQREAGGLKVGEFSSLVISSSQFLDNAVRALGFGGGGMEISVQEGSEARIIASIISGNTAAAGGGIQVKQAPGKLQIIGSKIANNHAIESGGGLLVLEDPITHQSADLSIVRSKIIGNFAETGNGGGMEILGDGEFTMQSSQVAHNSALNGGGVALFKTTPAEIIGGVIAQNSAIAGGGIRAASPLELRATRILGNSAQEVGGGIRSTDALNLELCTVSGNVALFGGGIFTTQEVLQTNSKISGNVSSDGQQIVLD